jgi:hypothetical protein
MLPILRILPVGGLLLAILILVLALSPPDGSRAPLSSSAIVPSRGALLDRERQAEVRQFLIHAALKRADELNRLRELPDTPARSDNVESTVASLPGDRSEADPGEPASINEAPVVSIPVEIGEPSPVELPVAAPEESVPATKKAEPAAKLQRETRRRIHRIGRVRAPANPTPPRPFNLLEALFGGPQYQQPTYGGQQTVQQYRPVPDVAAQANPNAFSTVPRTNPY